MHRHAEVYQNFTNDTATIIRTSQQQMVEYILTIDYEHQSNCTERTCSGSHPRGGLYLKSFYNRPGSLPSWLPCPRNDYHTHKMAIMPTKWLLCSTKGPLLAREKKLPDSFF